VRFFGGWDFASGDAEASNLADIGYGKGVPMGSPTWSYRDRRLDRWSAGRTTGSPEGASWAIASGGAPFVTDAAGTGLWTEGDAFVGVQSGDYWSATEYALDNSYAWSVTLTDGTVTGTLKTTLMNVWPVRSGL